MPKSAYPRVPPAKIESIGITSFIGGLDQRGEANIAPNSFSVGRNVMVTLQGLATYRLVLKKWLPDAVGTVYEVRAATYGGKTYYVIADDNKIKYCQDGDTAWTVAGGDTVTTGTGIITTFMRTADKLAILNGTDPLGYLDLTTMTVTHFSHVADPTSAPTGVLAGTLTAGSNNVYYSIAYNTIVGTTISTPIFTIGANKIREQWVAASGDGVTVTDPNTRPTGVTSWTLYMSTAASGATIQPSDMVPMALGLDIHTTTFTDNGTITPPTNAGTSPTVNSTQGPKAKYGVDIDGHFFLFGITGDPYAVMIGGDYPNTLDFSTTNGGYRLVLNQGTDFYPSAIVGFRNGQGLPSKTVLYSSVSGLSKASIIDQSTITLGNYSASVWGSIDQNYGAAGVSSPYSTIDYRGKLLFASTDGITSIDTSKLRFNVLTAERVSDPIIDEIGSISSDKLALVIGTSWANRMMFSAATEGFTHNNKILVYDVTRADNPIWYTFDIASQWIGTISPPSEAGFSYVSQDNHFFKLEPGYVAQDDTSTGLAQAFPMELTTALIGTNTAHDGYYAVVQAMFYLEDFLGTATLQAMWRDSQSGQMKSKQTIVYNGSYSSSVSGGWSSSGYLFNQVYSTAVIRWGDVDILTSSNASQKISKRYPLRLNNIVTNELQASVILDPDNSAVTVRTVTFQGQPLGVSPDIR